MRRVLGVVAVVAALTSVVAFTTPSRAAGRYQVPAARFGAKALCDVPIRMSDGVRLFADVVTPDVAGRYPTILTVTGYNKSPARYGSCDAADNAFVSQGPYVGRGYNRIVIDDRGTGNSEGSWDSWGDRMQQDYKEVLDWIVAQPWSNGDVGMTGASYMGITSFLVAEKDAERVAEGKKAAVKAIWADVPMADAYRDVTLHGGNIDSGFIPLWLGLVGGLGSPPPSWSFTDPQAALTTMASHAQGVAGFQGGSTTNFATNGDLAFDGPFYRLRSPETKAASLHIPVAWTGGWFDLFQRGEPRLYNALSGIDASQKKWFQSPTYHAAGNSHWDELGLGPKDAVVFAWFDHWLKGANNGIETIPSINTWAMGANRWEHPSAWPVPNTRWTSLYLDSKKAGSASSLNDGSLSPVGGFDATPGDPVPLGSINGLCSRSTTQWTAGLVLAGSPCETDNRLAEATALTYSTPVLSSDLQITGPLTATIWATLDRPDATFVALVSDVAPDGTSTQVTGGWLNASHRALDPARTQTANGQTIVPFHPFTKAAQQPAENGKATEYQIEIFPTSQVFKAGHRLRLTIATGEVPHISAPIPVAAAQLGGTATILHDNAHLSRLLLPVVGGPATASVLGNTVTAPAAPSAAPAHAAPGQLPATGASDAAPWIGFGLLFAGAAGRLIRRRYS